MMGSEIPALMLVDIVGSRQLRFESVERLDARVRLYGPAAAVTGQGRFGEQPFCAHSRYTHVYVRVGDTWQLASAQGTPMPPPLSNPRTQPTGRSFPSSARALIADGDVISDYAPR